MSLYLICRVTVVSGICGCVDGCLWLWFCVYIVLWLLIVLVWLVVGFGLCDVCGCCLGVCAWGWLAIGLVGFAVFDFGLLIVLCIIPLRFHCLLGFGLCV